MTVKAKRVKLGHPNKFLGQTEAFGDSDRGLVYFAKRGCARVDGNALLSRDNVLVNTHWAKFMRHGFIVRGAVKVFRGLPVGHFTADDLETQFWTRRGRYQIRRTVTRIRHAFHLGMDYELEIKEHIPADVVAQVWPQILQLEAQFPGRRVIVKVYNNRPGKAMWLGPWHDAGAPTLITTHTPFRATDKAAEPFADEYRGFKPRWK